MTAQNATAKKIAALNDALRKHGTGGRIMMTAGIQSLGQAAVNEILAKIRAFDAFTKDNDPYGEHDFASLTVKNNKIFFKIDYYDRNLQYASPDPADPTVTCRILTILLAEEY
ncbi:MAG: DUF3768 domain-containing protein [Rhodospirillaceae bacterium]